MVSARADHCSRRAKNPPFFWLSTWHAQKDHASEGLSREAHSLDSRERRGTLVHALLKDIAPPLLFLHVFLLLQIGPKKA